MTWTNSPYSTLTTPAYKQFLANRAAADTAVDLLGAVNLPTLIERLGTRETGLTRFKHDLNAVIIRFGIRKPGLINTRDFHAVCVEFTRSARSLTSYLG